MEVIPDICIVPIVEGHGEVEAVPLLIRRIIDLKLNTLARINIAKPIRVQKHALINREGELGRVLQLAYLKTQQPGFVLILLDADDDCPATLGPSLLATARQLQSNV